MAVLAAEKAEYITGDQEKSLGSPLTASINGGEKQGSSTDEFPVEINHAKELLKGRAVGRCREAGDGGDMLAEGG